MGDGPIDKGKIVFFVFLLQGFGTLMPWNTLITAKSYFIDYKLQSENSNGTVSEYAGNFLQYLSFASQVPNVIFNWVNIFVKLGGNLTDRILYSIFLIIVIFILTMILAMIDSSGWPGAFFWITMATATSLNIINAFYQNTVYGIAATIDLSYTGAVVIGTNTNGCIIAIISICSVFIFSSNRTAAIYYFLSAVLILMLCCVSYYALPLNQFFRHHSNLKEQEKLKETSGDASARMELPYWEIFKTASPQLFNVFYTFFITLAVFPAVYSDVSSVDDDFFISEKYFVPIMCFLTFNTNSMLGSMLTNWVRWPKPKYVVIPVVLRTVFLPLFLFCNYHPKNVKRTLPVLIKSNWVFWVIGSIMSFSSGYFISLSMMYTPTMVESKYQLTAGMFGSAMLITGVFVGVLFSFLFVFFV